MFILSLAVNTFTVSPAAGGITRTPARLHPRPLANGYLGRLSAYGLARLHLMGDTVFQFLNSPGLTRGPSPGSVSGFKEKFFWPRTLFGGGILL